MAHPQLVVMAAGQGSRYGGLKQVDPVGPAGEVLLDYAVYDAIRADFAKVVFVIRPDFAEAFRTATEWVARRVETAYVFQELDALPGGLAPPPGRIKSWGTGQAVLAAKDAVDAPFSVINADDFYGAEAFQAIADHLRTAGEDTPGEDTPGVADFCMVGYVLERTLTEHGHVARGVCSVDDSGYLARIVERVRIQRFGTDVRYTEDGQAWHDLAPDTTVSMNMWGFTPCFLDAVAADFEAFLAENLSAADAEFLLVGVVDAMIRSGKARVTVLPTGAQWYGVTYRQDKPRVRQAIADMVRRGVYPADLRA